MTWTEFEIRSFGFNRMRKWEMSLTREVAYEIHTLKYMFGKTKPPTKEKYWPLEGKKKGVSDAVKKKLREEWQKYKAQKDGSRT